MLADLLDRLFGIASRPAPPSRPPGYVPVVHPPPLLDWPAIEKCDYWCPWDGHGCFYCGRGPEVHR